MKKRFLIFLLLAALLMTALLTGCTDNNTKNNSTASETQTQQDTAGVDENSNELSSSSQEVAPDQEQTEPAQNDEVVTNESSSDNTESSGKHILVVYFSATGTTKSVAETIANTLDADLFEIVPEFHIQAPISITAILHPVPQRNKTTHLPNRQSTEQLKTENNTTLFLSDIRSGGEIHRGSSIPSQKGYDFKGKTVAPFCTSGGSGISVSESTLKDQVSGAAFLDRKRFNAGASENDILDWASSIGIE